MRHPVDRAAKARFGKITKKLERLNPGVDVRSLIDNSLEPEEALADLKTKNPSIKTDEYEDVDMTETYREALQDQYAIGNRRVQNMIATSEPPLSEDEMQQTSFLLNGGRTLRAEMIDKSKQAQSANNIRDWLNHPNRRDIPTVDNKSKKYYPKYKQRLEDRPAWKVRVELDKQEYEREHGLF